MSDQAASVPSGTEFRVNLTTDDDQQRPAIAALADGGFVVTWESYGPGEGFGVFGQRYTADGSPLGSEFQIGSRTTDAAPSSSAAGLADGGFVVTWDTIPPGWEDDIEPDVYVIAQRYAADGTPAGGEFYVSTGFPLNGFSALTGLPDGGFVAAWVGFRSGDDGSIYARRFAADGSPAAATEFKVSTFDGLQRDPAIAALADGQFVVIWASAVLPSEGPQGNGISGQLYTEEGIPLGAEFRITDFQGLSENTAVTALKNGGFVVTWTSPDMGGPSGSEVFGRRYAPDGTPDGDEFRINTTTADDQFAPSVSALPNGGFVVAWTSVLQDGTPGSIYAQRFAPNGDAAGDEFLVNTHTPGLQTAPAVTVLSDGSFVITWQSEDQDGSGAGIYAQRFAAVPYAAPSDISLSGTSIVENAAAGTVIGTATAIDPDIGDVFVWSLVDDAGGLFAIDSATGALRATQPLDYETVPAHDVTVRVTDAAGLSYDETFTIGVQDVTTGDVYVGTDGDDTIPFPAIGNLDGVDGGAGTDRLILTAAAVAMRPTDDGLALYFELDGIDGAAADGTIDRVLTALNVEEVEIRAESATVSGDFAQTGLLSLSYLGGDTADILDASGVTSPLPIHARGYAGADVLIGGAGIDTADYSASNGRVTVSLTSGNGWYGHAAGDTFSGIENVVGSAFADALKGDSGANRLEGGAGNDTLDGQAGNDVLAGGAGADRLLGGAGVDTADYSASTGRVTVSLMSGSGWSGHAAGDTLDSIENAIGSAFDDSLKGTTGANRLDGGDGADMLDGQAGNDVLAGGAGADRLLGGAGVDTADYSASTGRVTVSLMSGSGWSGHAAGDTLDSIENAIGSAFDDSLKGTTGANRLEGGAGDDTLDGQAGNDVLAGGAGADRLLGGAGIDTADYTGSAGRVTVSLMSGNGWYGHASGDTLSGVENVIGSAFGDSLKGDGGANRLEGGAGDDTLDGQGGNDVLVGGAGNDRMVGGGGNDRFVFGNGVGDDTITDFIAGAGTPDAIDLSANSLLNGFAAVLTHSSQSGLNTLIDLGGGDLLTLLGVTRTSLHQDDFVF